MAYPSKGLMRGVNDPTFKKLRRFYEPLLFLDALGQVRGDRTKARPPLETDRPEAIKACRDFSDAIAYIAAREKKPACVTAAVLGRTATNVTVLIAANENVKQEVIDFLKSLLQKIADVAAVKPEKQRREKCEELLPIATNDVITFGNMRLKVYYGLTRGKVEEFLTDLDASPLRGMLDRTLRERSQS